MSMKDSWSDIFENLKGIRFDDDPPNEYAEYREAWKKVEDAQEPLRKFLSKTLNGKCSAALELDYIIGVFDVSAREQAYDRGFVDALFGGKRDHSKNNFNYIQAQKDLKKVMKQVRVMVPNEHTGFVEELEGAMNRLDAVIDDVIYQQGFEDGSFFKDPEVILSAFSVA